MCENIERFITFISKACVCVSLCDDVIKSVVGGDDVAPNYVKRTARTALDDITQRHINR